MKAVTKLKKRPVKLIKIRFTSWRDQSVAPRTSAFKDRLDALTTRISSLSAAAARIRDERTATDRDMCQTRLDRIRAERETLDAERIALLSAEKATADAETRAARAHKKCGTFGYQILNKAGTYVAMVVDESGEYLPRQAVYSYEVVDDDPPLPEWAKKGTFGH